MIKILFIDHTPFIGGAQLVLAEHIAALDKSQFEVHVACTRDVPELVDKFSQAGATVHVVPMPRLRGANIGTLANFWHSVRAIRQLIKDQQVQLVVTNTTRASYAATVAVIGQRAKLIWWVRDYLYPKSLFHLLVWRVSKVFYVSKAVRDWYGQSHSPKSAILYVASNLYLSLAEVSSKKTERQRAAYGFGPDDIVVGFMGRLVAEKGAQDAVEAVAALSSTYPRLKLLLVGTGHGQMHDVEETIRQSIEQHHLQDVIKMAGYQSDEALFYSMFDIFVLATRDHEPYATSVVQAMMAGKPVVGTDAGGTPELINDHTTGLLYQPGNVAELVKAIETLVSDPKLAAQLAESGKRHVLEFNREDQLARKAEKLYSQVATGNSSL